ncbi:MAG: 50S ribosomal protein L4 [Candidatus Shapirobacteria bacterium]|nr:50S ribosomal protein L4 [Candidatus Shapirobacteria bacterium]
MKAPIYNLKAETTGDMILPKMVFDVTVNDALIATTLRIYQSNLRSSHAKVKDRGEVGGTTKKMWAQKGTGRARHGSAKAPQFIGGGVAQGPQGNQTFKLKLNKKIKKIVTSQILTKFAGNKAIIIIDEFKDLAAKTKAAQSFINKLEIDNKSLSTSKKVGLITSDGPDNVTRAFRNIPGIKLMSLKSLNPLNLSNQNFLIMSLSAVTDLAKPHE